MSSIALPIRIQYYPHLTTRIGRRRTARAYLISTNIDEIAVVAFTAFPQGSLLLWHPTKSRATVLRRRLVLLELCYAYEHFHFFFLFQKVKALFLSRKQLSLIQTSEAQALSEGHGNIGFCTCFRERWSSNIKHSQPLGQRERELRTAVLQPMKETICSRV